VRRYLTRLAVFAGCFAVADVLTLIVVVVNERAGAYGVTDAIAIPILNTLFTSFVAIAWFFAMTLVVMLWTDMRDLFSSKRLMPLRLQLGKGGGIDD